MHIERRRFFRRAVSGGVVFAAVSMIPVVLIELLYVLLVRKPYFATPGEPWRFGLYLFLLLMGLAVVVGAMEGLLTLGITFLAHVLAKKRVAEAKWVSLLSSIICIPAIAVVSSKIFEGRRARLIPYKDLWAVLIGLVGILAMWGVFRLIVGVRDRFSIKRWGPKEAWLIFPLLIIGSVILYFVDQRILTRLYGFFHIGLAVFYIAGCQLAVGVLYAAYRPKWRTLGRFAEPSTALLVLLAGISAGAYALTKIEKSETLRYVYHEYTALQSKTLGLAAEFGRGGGSEGSSLFTDSNLASGQSTEPVSALQAGPRRPDMSVIMLSIDAARADHLGFYGYPRHTTPHLDQWAKTAVVFEQPFCQAPHTSYSVTSLNTGSYTYSTNGLDQNREYLTMADVLRRYGYKTAGFFPPAVFYIDQQNFTNFEKSSYGFEYVKYEFLDAEGRVDQIIDFLKEHPQRRVFVWAHFFEPHEPYDHREAFNFGPKAMDRYDGELAYVDWQIGRLLEYVKQKMPNTIVAVTGDHGEEFGEHGSHYHGNALYQQQVRVPLAISIPNVAPRRVAGPAEIIDLPPTLISLLDIPAPAQMHGDDLGPWLAGEDPSKLPPAFCEIENKKMVTFGANKLICDTARDFCELYNLTEDPGEERNLAGAKPALVSEGKRKLVGWMASRVEHAGAQAGISESDALLERGRKFDPGAIDGLIKLLSSSKVELRREVAQVLAAMRSLAARESLMQAAQNDQDPQVRLQALVGAALVDDAQAKKEMPALLKRIDLPPAMRRDAMIVLARSGDISVAKPLADYLRGSEDIAERIDLIKVLGALGDKGASEALVEQMRTLRTRLYAIEALGHVKATTATSDIITSLLNDRFISWRRAAAVALGKIGTPEAKQALHQAARQDLESAVVSDVLSSLANNKGWLPVNLLARAKLKDWECQDSKCEMQTFERCEFPRERDILLAAQQKAKSKMSIVAYCGQKEIGSWLIEQQQAAMIHVPVGTSGPLILKAGNEPVPIIYSAWRVTPKKSVD